MTFNLSPHVFSVIPSSEVMDRAARDPAALDSQSPVTTTSLFAELGLAPEDVDALAQIPESEISIETLPYLIMQLKAKKVHQGPKHTKRVFKTADASKTPWQSAAGKTFAGSPGCFGRRQGSGAACATCLGRV